MWEKEKGGVEKGRRTGGFCTEHLFGSSEQINFWYNSELKTFLGMLHMLQRPTGEFNLDVISMKKVTFIVLLCIIDHMKGLL